METYQCPCCELRFRIANELIEHVSSDHPKFNIDASKAMQALLGSHRHRHASHHEASSDRNSP